jgi:hypothetical protein
MYFLFFYIFFLKNKFKFQNSVILKFGPVRFRRISSNFVEIRRICEPWVGVLSCGCGNVGLLQRQKNEGPAISE